MRVRLGVLARIILILCLAVCAWAQPEPMPSAPPPPTPVEEVKPPPPPPEEPPFWKKIDWEDRSNVLMLALGVGAIVLAKVAFRKMQD
jgi:hypothetical protein